MKRTLTIEFDIPDEVDDLEWLSNDGTTCFHDCVLVEAHTQLLLAKMRLASKENSSRSENQMASDDSLNSYYDLKLKILESITVNGIKVLS
jgi:molybdopterin-guanine dinucleotide biosynthesis protein